MGHAHLAAPRIARGVRTNSVCPAPIDTPLLNDFKATMGEQIIQWTAEQATGALMTPREVAMPLAFLGSDAAAYVNGHDLVADGGFNAAMTTGQVDFSGLMGDWTSGGRDARLAPKGSSGASPPTQCTN